jgi:LmbE family N-acetylglucosaminyl deacetylase
LAGLPAWQPALPPTGRVIVVAPHPDDEVFGIGGTAARLRSEGAQLELVAVTDGERSHPGQEDHLRTVRPQETLAAAGRLGLTFGPIYRLQHPDGEVDEHLLESQLVKIAAAGDLVLAPWSRDGHPDHDVVGRASERAAMRVGATLMQYLVWAWHWATPEDLPWGRAQRVDFPNLADRKRDAAACFASQITGDPAILPPHVRSRLLRSFEVLLRA